MRLSELFGQQIEGGEVALELVVVQLNINPGFNAELKSTCKALGEYMLYVMKVRCYRERVSGEAKGGGESDEYF